MNPLVGPIKLNASVKFHPFNLTYNYTLLEIKLKWFIFIIMKKVCKYCGIEKDIDSYYKKISSTDGHQSVCKICTSIVTREYREGRIDVGEIFLIASKYLGVSIEKRLIWGLLRLGKVGTRS
jgi:hypothetical protein